MVNAFKKITILFFFFLIYSNSLFAILDPALFEGFDQIKLKKEFEHLNLLHGALLLQSGTISNICNYPISSLENEKRDFTYPTEEFVSTLFNSAGSDLPAYLKLSNLASNFSPFLTLSTLTSLLNSIKDFSDQDFTNQKRVEEALQNIIRSDLTFQTRVKEGEDKILAIQNLYKECLLLNLKSRCDEESFKLLEKSSITDIIEKYSTISKCQDFEDQLSRVKSQFSFKLKYLNNFVKKLYASLKSEREVGAKYPKHFTEQILLAAAWQLTKEDKKLGQKDLLKIYDDLKIISERGDIKEKKYDEHFYKEIVSSPELIRGPFEDQKGLLTFLLMAGELFDHSSLPEIGYKSIQYKMKKSGRVVNFADCMDSSLLNFLAIVLKNGPAIDLNFLSKFNGEGKSKIFSFFEKYRNSKDIAFDIGVHEEWAKLVEEVDHVEYVKNKGYEIETKIKNIFPIIDHLFFEGGKGSPFSKLKSNSEKLNALCKLFSRENYLFDWRVEKGKKEDLKDNEFANIVFSINQEDAFLWKIGRDHAEINKIEKRQNQNWKKRVLTMLSNESDTNQKITDLTFKLKALFKEDKPSHSKERTLQYFSKAHLVENRLSLLHSILESENLEDKRTLSTVEKMVKNIPEDEYSQMGLLDVLLNFPNMFRKQIDEMTRKIDNLYYIAMNSSEHGHLNILKYIIEDRNYRETETFIDSFKKAAERGHLEIVKYLSDKKGIDAEGVVAYAFIAAAENGHLDVLKYLMNKKGIDPTVEDNLAFKLAALNGHQDILQYLKEFKGVSTTETRNDAYINAATNGHLDIMKYFIEEEKVDPTIHNSDAFLLAASNGHLDVLNYLLKFKGIDPAGNNNIAFRWAAYHGQLEILKFLIDKKGVDPAAENSEAYRLAADSGHLGILKYLQDKKGVDPTANSNEAYKRAMGRGHLEVAEYIKGLSFSNRLKILFGL